MPGPKTPSRTKAKIAAKSSSEPLSAIPPTFTTPRGRDQSKLKATPSARKSPRKDVEVEVEVPALKGRLATPEPAAESDFMETDVEATPRPTRVDVNGVGVGVVKGRKRVWVDEAWSDDEGLDLGGPSEPTSEPVSNEQSDHSDDESPETSNNPTSASTHSSQPSSPTPAQSDSDSDSDDEAPEAASLSTSRAETIQAAIIQQQAVRELRERKRQTRRAREKTLKEQRQGKKGKAEPVEEDGEEETGRYLPMDLLENLEKLEESEPAPSNRHIRLDQKAEQLLQSQLQKKKRKLEKDRIVSGIRITPLSSAPAPRVADDAVLAFRDNALFRKNVRRGNAVKGMAGRDSRTTSAVVFVRKGN
ncbi:hypothetical protein HK097_008899 [Rhizophlyctis rosea]|uniref:Uncharacterized protein n=1 Tax=Rhizophlyctis rosea TaxID=64517 RepID=A0AAD5SCD7_9FUNG|nr:hypothetical protein HK097_008899 [Rhizophlyctis rosea]